MVPIKYALTLGLCPGLNCRRLLAETLSHFMGNVYTISVKMAIAKYRTLGEGEWNKSPVSMRRHDLAEMMRRGGGELTSAGVGAESASLITRTHIT